VIHKNGNHSHAKHWTMFVCLLTYSHLKCKFWVYQNSEALSAWTVSCCISIKRKTNQIRSRDRWAPLLACLCVTLPPWEIIVEKFCHIDKNWDTGPFCLKKKVILPSFPKCDIIHTSSTKWCECL